MANKNGENPRENNNQTESSKKLWDGLKCTELLSHEKKFIVYKRWTRNNDIWWYLNWKT